MAFAKTSGAPPQTLVRQEYTHKASGHTLFYITIHDKASDANQAAALSKLISAYGLVDVINCLSQGLNLAAGTAGRGRWDAPKADGKKTKAVVVS